MIRYIFRQGPITIKAAKKANPQRIGEALAKIAEKTGGELRPKPVVEAARDPKSPLHKHFEWNDAVAAESYRLTQAREIIRVIVADDDATDEAPAPAWLSIHGKKGTTYRSIGDIRTSPDLQALVLAQAERDLDAFDQRYRQLEDVCALVREAREVVRDKRAKRIEKDSRAAA